MQTPSCSAACWSSFCLRWKKPPQNWPASEKSASPPYATPVPWASAHISKADAADVLEALPTDTVGIGPYLCIVDEYAAIVTPGFEVVLTQGRGLGIAAIVASQDYAGILEADKKARSRWWPTPP